MRRRVSALFAAVAATIVFGTAAPASAGTQSPRAGCVGIVTSWEATELPAGSVGGEVSELAGRGFGAGFVAPLAKYHLGSLDGCATVVG
jgi:hypothetical protein